MRIAGRWAGSGWLVLSVLACGATVPARSDSAPPASAASSVALAPAAPSSSAAPTPLAAPSSSSSLTAPPPRWQRLLDVDRGAGGELPRLALDDDNIYVVAKPPSSAGTGGKPGALVLQRLAKSGGPVTTLAECPSCKSISRLVVDETSVYWANAEKTGPLVMRADKAGGKSEVLWRARGKSVGADIAVDEKLVYASVHFAQRSAIVEIPKAGGTAKTLIAITDDKKKDGWPVSGIAVDGDSVYTVNAQTGAVLQIDKQGGKAKTLATLRTRTPSPNPLLNDPFEGCLAADATALYVCTDELAVLRIPKAGGTPTKLFEGAPWYTQFTIDGDRLWLTGYFLAAAPTAGGDPVPVDLPSGMDLWPMAFPAWSVDRENLYVTLQGPLEGPNGLYRLAKPK